MQYQGSEDTNDRILAVGVIIVKLAGRSLYCKASRQVIVKFRGLKPFLCLQIVRSVPPLIMHKPASAALPLPIVASLPAVVAGMATETFKVRPR